MIKVFQEVSSLDKKCYEKYHLSEDLLMEHAAMGLQNALAKERQKVLIVAGAGNNGADGIALARLITSYHDSVLFLPLGTKSPMAKIQEERAKAVGVNTITKLEGDYDVVVDCLFGSGLTRALDEKIQALLRQLNEMKCYKVACDIPTGISLEGKQVPEPFIADVTITMGAYKEVLFLDEVKDYVGEIKVVNLGVEASLYAGESQTFVLEKSDMKLPHRYLQNTHKGSFGHVAVVAGEKQGAGILAAKAALSFGVGLVSVLTDKSHNVPYELMTTTTLPKTTTAVCIGMGLGKVYEDASLSEFLYHDKALLVDADLFYDPIMIDVLKRKNLLLTPHPKEFVSLLKMTKIADIDIETLQKKRFFYGREFSKKFPNVTLLLKGANTLIIKNGRMFIQPFGSSVLSKGGSGDVLAGFLASLLAQGYAPLDAAITGSLAHALSLKNFNKNSYALTPNDLIEGVKCL